MLNLFAVLDVPNLSSAEEDSLLLYALKVLLALGNLYFLLDRCFPLLGLMLVVEARPQTSPTYSPS